MKKIISLVLSLVLILSAFPICVSAAEVDHTLSKDEAIALALETFPEYADSILGKNKTYAAPANADETPAVLFQETREISDEENLTYVQLSDGNALLLYDYAQVTSSTDKYDPFVGGALVRKSFTVYHTDPYVTGKFYLKGVDAYIYNDDYDRIVDTGSPSVNDSGSCGYRYSGDLEPEETSEYLASFSYSVWFMEGSETLYYTLDIIVGDNSFTANVW